MVCEALDRSLKAVHDSFVITKEATEQGLFIIRGGALYNFFVSL